MPNFIYKALNNEVLPLFNGGDASRDFIFVEDICRGLMACALRGKAGDVYNLASGQEVIIKDLAQLIVDLTGSKAGLEILPKRTWDTSGKRFGSTEKSKAQLGFEATANFRDGVEATVRWTQTNLQRINSCILKHKEMMQK